MCTRLHSTDDDSRRVLRLSGFSALQLPSNLPPFVMSRGSGDIPKEISGATRRWFRVDRETMGSEYQRNVKAFISSLLLLLALGRWPGRLTYHSHGLTVSRLVVETVLAYNMNVGGWCSRPQRRTNLWHELGATKVY